MHKRFFRETKRKEPKTTLIEKVFILTFFTASYIITWIVNTRANFLSSLNGKSYFINFSTIWTVWSVRCVFAVLYMEKEIKHILATKLITKILHNKNQLLLPYREALKLAWNFQNVSHKNSILYTDENFLPSETFSTLKWQHFMGESGKKQYCDEVKLKLNNMHEWRLEYKSIT